MEKKRIRMKKVYWLAVAPIIILAEFVAVTLIFSLFSEANTMAVIIGVCSLSIFIFIQIFIINKLKTQKKDEKSNLNG